LRKTLPRNTENLLVYVFNLAAPTLGAQGRKIASKQLNQKKKALARPFSF
jgi:hypothetical protein